MQEIFDINTKIEKNEVRKFLYKANLLSDKRVIPLIIIVSIVGSIFLNMGKASISIIAVITTSITLFAIITGFLFYMVEQKNKSKLQDGKKEIFGKENNFKFYDNKLVVMSKYSDLKVEKDYKSMIGIVQNKYFFSLYISKNKALFIKKKDISNLEEFEKFIQTKFGNKYKK